MRQLAIQGYRNAAIVIAALVAAIIYLYAI